MNCATQDTNKSSEEWNFNYCNYPIALNNAKTMKCWRMFVCCSDKYWVVDTGRRVVGSSGEWHGMSLCEVTEELARKVNRIAVQNLGAACMQIFFEKRSVLVLGLLTSATVRHNYWIICCNAKSMRRSLKTIGTGELFSFVVDGITKI